MRLTFGDMTKEVNIFHLGKQPRDLDNESFEVNLIEGLTSEHDMEIEYESAKDLNWSLMTSTLIKSSSPQWSGPQMPPLSFPCTRNNH